MELKALVIFLLVSACSAQITWDNSEWTPLTEHCKLCRKARLLGSKTNYQLPEEQPAQRKRQTNNAAVLPGQLFAYKSKRQFRDIEPEPSKVKLVYVPEGSIEELRTANLAKISTDQIRPPRQITTQSLPGGDQIQNFNQHALGHVEPRRPAALVAQIGQENVAQQQIQLLEAALNSQSEVPTNGQLPRVFIAPTHIPPPPGYVKIPLIPNQNNLASHGNAPGTFLTSDIRDQPPPGFIQLPLPQSVAHLSNNIPFVIPENSQSNQPTPIANSPRVNHFVARPPPPPPRPSLNAQNHFGTPQIQNNFPTQPQKPSHRFSSPIHQREQFNRPNNRFFPQPIEQQQETSQQGNIIPSLIQENHQNRPSVSGGSRQQEDRLPTNEGPSSFRQLSNQPINSLNQHEFAAPAKTKFTSFETGKLDFSQGKSFVSHPPRNNFNRQHTNSDKEPINEPKSLSSFDDSTSLGNNFNRNRQHSFRPLSEANRFSNENFGRDSLIETTTFQHESLITDSPIDEFFTTESPFISLEPEIEKFKTKIQTTTASPPTTFARRPQISNVNLVDIGNPVVPSARDFQNKKHASSFDLSNKRRGSFTRNPNSFVRTEAPERFPSTSFQFTTVPTLLAETETPIFTTEKSFEDTLQETTTEGKTTIPINRRPNISRQQAIRSRNRHRFTSRNTSRDPLPKPTASVDPVRTGQRRRVRVKGRRRPSRRRPVKSTTTAKAESSTDTRSQTTEAPLTTTTTASTSTLLPPFSVASKLVKPEQEEKKKVESPTRRRPPGFRHQFGSRVRSRTPTRRQRPVETSKVNENLVERNIDDLTAKASDSGATSAASTTATPNTDTKKIQTRRRRVRVRAGQPLPDWLAERRRTRIKSRRRPVQEAEQDLENQLNAEGSAPVAVSKPADASGVDPVEETFALLQNSETQSTPIKRRRIVKVARRVPRKSTHSEITDTSINSERYVKKNFLSQNNQSKNNFESTYNKSQFIPLNSHSPIPSPSTIDSKNYESTTSYSVSSLVNLLSFNETDKHISLSMPNNPNFLSHLFPSDTNSTSYTNEDSFTDGSSVNDINTGSESRIVYAIAITETPLESQTTELSEDSDLPRTEPTTELPDSVNPSENEFFLPFDSLLHEISSELQFTHKTKVGDNIDSDPVLQTTESNVETTNYPIGEDILTTEIPNVTDNEVHTNNPIIGKSLITKIHSSMPIVCFGTGCIHANKIKLSGTHKK